MSSANFSSNDFIFYPENIKIFWLKYQTELIKEERPVR